MLLRAAVLISALALAIAQSLDETCTEHTWSFNSQQISPCTLWQDLSTICSFGQSTLTARFHLLEEEYRPPTSDLPCDCNVVAFNLASACALCQPSFNEADFITEADWRAGCTRYNTTGYNSPRFNEVQRNQISALDIPSWAFLEERNGTFQANLARRLAMDAGASEFTRTPVSTSSSPSNTPSATPDPDGGPNISAIVGGVVGGVGGLALVGFIVWMLLRCRRQRRNEPALASTRALSPEKEYGIPSDLKVQHFVPPPPSSGAASHDNLAAPPVGALSSHPFAANYAVHSNMPRESPRSYTSSSNYDALAGQSIMPFDTHSIEGALTSGFVAEPSTLHESSYGHGSPASRVSSPSHPYANPVVQDSYTRTTPESPVARHSPWGGPSSTDTHTTVVSNALPPLSPTRHLPPLRVPQPVRHESTSTAEFSAASWTSSAPLVPNAHQPRQSSIDEVVGSSTRRTPRQVTASHPPTAWTIE